MLTTHFSCRALVVATVVTVALSASPAQADTIDLVSGSPCVWSLACGPLPYTGGTLTLTSNGNFEYKDLNGRTGLGISGSGNTGGEIDVNEYVTGTFSTPTVVEAFRLLFLYNGPEFGDPIERAQVSLNNGAFVATLIPGLVDNTATWSLGGAAIVNCGATTESGTGCFDVLMPFGTTLVSNITFTALFSGEDPTHNSDFSLTSLQVSPVRDTTVPEPATWILVGTGAAAALRARRRRHLSATNMPAV